MSTYKGTQSITDSLLLAPACDNDISKKENFIIKEALFEFLSRVNWMIHNLRWIVCTEMLSLKEDVFIQLWIYLWAGIIAVITKMEPCAYCANHHHPNKVPTRNRTMSHHNIRTATTTYLVCETVNISTTVSCTTNLAGSSFAISVFAGHAHWQSHESNQRRTSPSHYKLL